MCCSSPPFSSAGSSDCYLPQNLFPTFYADSRCLPKDGIHGGFTEMFLEPWFHWVPELGFAASPWKQISVIFYLTKWLLVVGFKKGRQGVKGWRSAAVWGFRFLWWDFRFFDPSLGSIWCHLWLSPDKSWIILLMLEKGVWVSFINLHIKLF